MSEEMLPVIWFGLIGFALITYVILDGYTLGIGILFPFVGEEEQRGIMMTTVTPFWDGNQTWLVLSAAGLYGAFPLVYATLLPAMYLPLVLMLMCLFFRGMAFEFRFEAHSRKNFDRGFVVATVLTAFIQGMVAGSVISGLRGEGNQYAEGPMGWFSWFGVCAGLALIVGYALLGAAWLVVKTEGRLQRRFYRMLRPLTLLFLLGMAIVAIWTPLANSRIAERWFSFPNSVWLGGVVALILLLALSVIRSAARRRETLLFLQVAGLFVLGLLGLVVSLFPVMIPPDITIWNAASHRASQTFLLVGYAILVPIILGYTAYSYRVFRGKVRESEG
ncbi:cytochrome d ubiquinol oxidase subunit II [Halomonas sp. WWR20]